MLGRPALRTLIDFTSAGPVWPDLGMGDRNAIDLAEEMHFEVLRDGMQARHAMIFPRPLPFNFEVYFPGRND